MRTFCISYLDFLFDKQICLSMDNMDDIFSDLDTSFLDLFRRQQISDLFARIPVEEHNIRLRRLNEIIRTENFDHIFEITEDIDNANRIISLRWVYWIVPLPIINFEQLRRRCRVENYTTALLFILDILSSALLRFRMLIINWIIFVQYACSIHELAKIFTESDSVLRDLVTYFYKDDKELLLANEKLVTRNLNVSCSNIGSKGEKLLLQDNPYNTLASLLRTKCFPLDGSCHCRVEEKVQLLNFSNYLRSHLMQLGFKIRELWYFKLSIVAAYLMLLFLCILLQCGVYTRAAQGFARFLMSSHHGIKKVFIIMSEGFTEYLV